MIRFFFITILCFLFGLQSSYADSYSCAKTFKTVNTGDTMDAVRTACGDPTAISTRHDQVNTPIQVTRWLYMALINAKTPMLPVFSVSFHDNKVVQIEKSNVFSPFTGSFSCLWSGMLKTGMSSEEVLMLCGSPSNISTSEIAATSEQSVVVWLYDMGQFQPKIQFEFENGKLTQIKRN